MDTTTETKVAVIPAPGPEQEKALTEEITSIEQHAETFIVETEDDYRMACDFGRALKNKSAEVKAFFKPMKDSAYQAHKAVCDRENAMLKPLVNAEKIIKAACTGYLREQERKRKEAEEAARRAIEAERERMLKEAAEAEAAGNAAKAEEALQEAIIMDDAKNVSMAPAATPKVEGTSVKKDWEISFINAAEVPDQFNGVVLKKVDEAAILKLIRATKGTIQIPGVKYRETASMAFRR